MYEKLGLMPGCWTTCFICIFLGFCKKLSVENSRVNLVFACICGFKRQAPTDSSGFLLTHWLRQSDMAMEPVPLKQMIFPLKSFKPPFIDCLVRPDVWCLSEAKCSVSQRGLGRTKGRETTSNSKWYSTKNHLFFGFTLLYSLYNNYYYSY